MHADLGWLRKAGKFPCFSYRHSGADLRSKVLIVCKAPYIVAGGTWQETSSVYLSDIWSFGSLESRRRLEIFLKQKTPLGGDVFCETFLRTSNLFSCCRDLL